MYSTLFSVQPGWQWSVAQKLKAITWPGTGEQFKIICDHKISMSWKFIKCSIELHIFDIWYFMCMWKKQYAVHSQDIFSWNIS